jgi:hypothetical protein
MASTFREAFKKPQSEAEEDQVRNPNQKVGKGRWFAAEGVCHEDEKKVAEGNGEAQGKAHRGFFSMSGDAKGNGDEGEGDAGEGS